MLADNDTPVLMDFGSMGPARMEISNSYQARAMTVRNFNLNFRLKEKYTFSYFS